MNKSITILILGAGLMQIPAITIAKRKGWRVIAVDRDEKAAGVFLADYFEAVDLKDKEAILAAAVKYNNRYGLDAVFTAGTDFSTSVAYTAEKLGLPGIPYKIALNATDKALMRGCFSAHRIPSPGFAALTAQDNPYDVLNDLCLPLVVKPVDSMGARGVIRIDHKEDLLPNIEKAFSFSRSKKVIVEEFMEGIEFSIDSLVYKGEIHIYGVADRHIYFPPYFIEMGHTMPTDIPAHQLDDIINVFKQGVKSLGIDHGAAKGDIMLTKQGAKIGEIAARLSGGYMSGWTYPYASGIEVTEGALNIAAGLAPGIKPSSYNGYSAERAFLSIPGIVYKFEGVQTARTLNHVEDVFPRIKPGDTVAFPRNNVEKCGNIISRAQTRTSACGAAESVVRALRIILTPDNNATEDFLFSGSLKEYKNFFAFRLPSNSPVLQQILEMADYQYTGDINEFDCVSVIPVKGIEKEQVMDWHYLSLRLTMDIIDEQLLASSNGLKQCRALSGPVGPGRVFFLGKIFWYALLKGGYQAGIYCIHTLNNLVKQPAGFMEKIESWRNSISNKKDFYQDEKIV